MLVLGATQILPIPVFIQHQRVDLYVRRFLFIQPAQIHPFSDDTSCLSFGLLTALILADPIQLREYGFNFKPFVSNLIRVV